MTKELKMIRADSDMETWNKKNFVQTMLRILFTVYNPLLCFFDNMWMPNQKFFATGQIINQYVYLYSWNVLWESFQRKRYELWLDKRILHQNNTPAVFEVLEFLFKKTILKSEPINYLTRLILWGFWLFPKLKNFLEGQKFAAIQQHATASIKILQRKSSNNVSRKNTIATRNA